MKRCGIYTITHAETGRVYVGQSIDINRRVKRHRYSRRTDTSLLARALLKYGWLAFELIVLEQCERAHLNARESHWIKHLDCVYPNGYNLTSGGYQPETVCDATRAKQSASAKRRGRHSDESRVKAIATRRAANNGKIVFSDEHRKKLSLASLGKKKSLKHAANVKKAKSYTSPETRAKMSLSAKGRRLGIVVPL